ncbi:MAG TPA: DNA translocase FtsK [Candidatus Dormibacteraeota bacterium]|nr:DNA translocase FtsK [Candidatus Dormibacteraeota bacterium]
MARVKRRAAASRLNYEILGIVLLGLAALLAVTVVAPQHAGALGGWIGWGVGTLFGRAAVGFPALIAILAGIVFLEISVPQMIRTLWAAACAFFLLGLAALGPAGGAAGSALSGALAAVVGDVGRLIFIALAALAVAVWITGVSLKRVIGLLASWGIAAARTAARLMPRLPARAPRYKVRGGRRDIPAIVPAAGRSAASVTAPAAGDEELEEIEEIKDLEELEDDDAEAAPAPLAVVAPLAAAPVARSAPQEPPERVVGERVYRLPDLALFDRPDVRVADESNRAHLLEDTLASFGVGAKVVHIERGPSITRYELKPDRGVKISRISSLADDLALALASPAVRIEAPIPGKSAVGIEVPNANVSVVAVREILEALPQRGQIPPLSMALGKDITGRPIFADLGKMPHLLVAGATGSGKSVCLNCIIASLLVCATPDQVQMLFIDPKRVELTMYNGIPHLVKEVITDARMAAGALFEMTKEMDQRYERFAKAGVRKIEEYNAKYPDERLPYVVVVIDELADLMLVAPAKVETTICRLAQLARATGIHLVVATQRPSVDVITGIIKANIPSRIAFAVSSQVDSRTILDMAGAERLLGRGDMLFLPIDAPKPVRCQGALVTNNEVARLVEFWAAQARPENLLDVEVTPLDDADERSGGKQIDPLCYEAAKFIIETSYASTAQLQSQFSIGHPRAVRLMKQLEDFKVVGPHEGTKPRKIQIGLGELEQLRPLLEPRQEQTLF